jgi:hypothetical protein
MANQSSTFAQKLRRLWLGLIAPSAPVVPPVIVHDPAAQRPHDLDDPFFDEKIQTRMGDVIGHAGQKK